MNCLGSALVAISGNKSGILFGHEIITHNGLESEILCLSSDNQNIPSAAWYHPTAGRIDTAIYKVDGSIEVEQNVISGVYQLVIKGELSRQDEGVYTCRVVHKNNATTYLTFGLYSDKGKYYCNVFPTLGFFPIILMFLTNFLSWIFLFPKKAEICRGFCNIHGFEILEFISKHFSIGIH